MKYTKHRIPWIKEPTLFKDSMIILGWVSGLIILAGLCWYFAQPVKTRFLVNSVNQILEQSGDTRRVLNTIPRENSRGNGLGRWYNFSDGTRVYIFTFIGDGLFFPCAAVMKADGRVEEFIPLGRHSTRMFQRISSEIIDIYSERFYSPRILRIEQDGS